MAGLIGPAQVRQLVSVVSTGQRRQLAFAVTLNCAYQALDVLVPVLVGTVVDQVITGAPPLTIAATLLGVLAAFGLRSLSYRFGFRAAQRTMVTAGERLRCSLMAGLLARGRGTRPDAPPGTVASVANVDTEHVSMVGFVLPQALSAALGLAVACGVLADISPWLGLVTVVTALAGLGALGLVAERVAGSAGDERAAAAAESAMAEDICQGMRVLRGLGRTASEAAGLRYRAASERARDAAVRSAREQARHRGVSTMVGGVVVAVGGGTGAWFVLSGDATIGGLVTAVGLLSIVQGSMSVLGWTLSELSQASASAARISRLTGDAVVESAALASGDRPDAPRPAGLELEELTVGALTGISLHAVAGDVIGLVTADTDTLVELFECLDGDRLPRAGRVRVAGTDLVPPSAPGAGPPGPGSVAVVDGAAGVLVDSFLDDVALLSPSPELTEQAVAATLTAEVLAGLDERAGQPGVQTVQVVSGGERQRLALLRAIVARPAILALHDATTALDPATEMHVIRSLVRLRADAVTLIATTSPIALAATTRVLMLDGAQVTENSHDALRRVDGRYREIVWGMR